MDQAELGRRLDLTQETFLARLGILWVTCESHRWD